MREQAGAPGKSESGFCSPTGDPGPSPPNDYILKESGSWRERCSWVVEGTSASQRNRGSIHSCKSFLISALRKGGQGLIFRLLLEETVNPFDSRELYQAGSYKGSGSSRDTILSHTGRSHAPVWPGVLVQEFEWSVPVQGLCSSQHSWCYVSAEKMSYLHRKEYSIWFGGSNKKPDFKLHFSTSVSHKIWESWVRLTCPLVNPLLMVACVWEKISVVYFRIKGIRFNF